MSNNAESNQSKTEVVEWILPEGIEKFSEEHLYHAHRAGINMGITIGQEQDNKLFEKQVLENVRIAAADTFKLIACMHQLNIKPLSANLKIESRYATKVLVTVSDSDFVKESFLELYDKAQEIHSQSRTDLYSIRFAFINRSSEFDDELVKLDGFTASFKPLESK